MTTPHTQNPSSNQHTSSSHQDRNFDDIAEHFAHKVYGGLKGKIRLAILWHDLQQHLPSRPLKVLDIGAGLGQISLRLAAQGHQCTLCDISSNMLAVADRSAKEQGLSVKLINAPYQQLPHLLDDSYDVVLCHALFEWVADPQGLLKIIWQLLTPQGILSLCFYNPAAPVYRNLIMGNFNYLNTPKPADMGSLTPNQAVAYDTVKSWLNHWHILHESGIRVFYDYTVHKRGGLADDMAVIEMELKYSALMPFRLMGRYLHIIAQKQDNRP